MNKDKTFKFIVVFMLSSSILSICVALVYTFLFPLAYMVAVEGIIFRHDAHQFSSAIHEAHESGRSSVSFLCLILVLTSLLNIIGVYIICKWCEKTDIAKGSDIESS